MCKHLRVWSGLAAIGSALLLAIPLVAQQPAAVAQPTAKDPIRFSAFSVSLQSGVSGSIQIAIERWTTDPERNGLLEVLAGANFRQGGQAKMLGALQNVTPRVGFIRTPNSLGWDLKYARENKLPEGMRQIVIATDKPVTFFAARNNTRSMDYPFTFVEMRMKPNNEGEGRLLAATAVNVKDGRLELENYGQEPVRMTRITEDK